MEIFLIVVDADEHIDRIYALKAITDTQKSKKRPQLIERREEANIRMSRRDHR